MKVTVITNGRGSRDYLRVVREDEVVFEDHRLWPQALVRVLEQVKGYDEVRLLELTDEQFDNWRAHL